MEIMMPKNGQKLEHLYNAECKEGSTPSIFTYSACHVKSLLTKVWDVRTLDLPKNAFFIPTISSTS